MTTNKPYKTLKGDAGVCVGIAVLNHFLEDAFDFEETVLLVQLEFGDGRLEWWLDSQLEEVTE